MNRWDMEVSTRAYPRMHGFFWMENPIGIDDFGGKPPYKTYDYYHIFQGNSHFRGTPHFRKIFHREKWMRCNFRTFLSSPLRSLFAWVSRSCWCTAAWVGEGTDISPQWFEWFVYHFYLFEDCVLRLLDIYDWYC